MECKECHGPINKQKKTICSSMVDIGCIVFRRAKPSDWKRNSVPGTYKQYGRIYDVLLVREKNETNFHFFSKNLCVGQDPFKLAEGINKHIVPKRCMYAGSAPVPMKAKEILVFALPVDSLEENSVDRCLAEDQDGFVWVRLHELLLEVRGLREFVAKSPIDSNSKRMLSIFEGWMLERHDHVRLVASIWRPHARSMKREYIRNSNCIGETPPNSKLRMAPISCINPMFKSTLVLPSAENKNNILTHIRISDTTELPLSYATHLEEYVAPEPPEDFVEWDEQYPLHFASMQGNAAMVHRYLSAYNPKSVDDDEWTPLHYACWFGREDIVRILLDDWKGGPDIRNSHGSTALHLAARNGHAEVVRLLVACPIVDVNGVNENGDTPAALCKKHELNEWQDVLDILSNPQKFMHAVNRFVKVKATHDVHLQNFIITFLDGTSKTIRLPSAEVSALDLRNATAAMIQMPEDLYSLFSLWAISSNKFQLEIEMSSSPLKMVQQFEKEMMGEGASDSTAQPKLVFKRASSVQLFQERRVLSQVALKLLFDEALHNILTSLWPTKLDDAVYLGGLLMQIRFGNHNEKIHKSGFLRDALDTFVPQHLLHNQLKTSEWESRIFNAHKAYKDNTDLVSLHRLYLQYCWQWPYYGSTSFDCAIVRSKRKNKTDPISLAINSNWLSIIMLDTHTLKATFSWDEIKSSLISQETLTFQLITSDSSKLECIRPYITNQNYFDVETPHAPGIEALIQKTLQQIEENTKEMEERRMAQGGPRVLRLVSDEPSHANALSKQEKEATQERMNNELGARLKVMQSFGETWFKKKEKSAAELVFDKYCRSGIRASIVDLKNIAFESGYWLGSELDGARMSLNVDGTGMFTFRDFVSWWTQSKRSFLYLLDDNAFKERQKCIDIFLRNDPKRTGSVSDDKFHGLVTGLRGSGITRKTEEAIRRGLDPSNNEYLTLNAFIDWLSHMNIISDCVLYDSAA
eukprot:m.34197 g.34197  ORF g.34197 m.34197 type:complete len:977 (-) comp6503_c0_seq2:291-3221(-)